MLPLKRKFGFTLIELLVVIAIISLLVSILLPSLNKAKDLARQAVCASILRSIGFATSLYAEDNNGKLQPFFDGTYYWADPMLLGQYMDDQIVGRASEATQCPSYDRLDSNDYNLVYGANYSAIFGYTTTSDNGSPAIDKIPSTQFLYGDCRESGIIYNPYLYGGGVMIRDNDSDGIADSATPYLYDMMQPRHTNKSTNLVFIDSSVRNYTLDQWIDNDGDIFGEYINR